MANSSMYHDGQRQLQEEFDTKRLADLMEAQIVLDKLNEKQKPSSRRPTCFSWPPPTSKAGQAVPTRAASRASSTHRRSHDHRAQLRW